MTAKRSSLHVKVRDNVLARWIISPVENKSVAWSGTRWVPINRNGLRTGETPPLKFDTPVAAVAYAASIGFEVEHG